MTLRPSLIVLVLASIAMSAPPPAWQSDPALIERLGKKRPDVIYDEAKVPKYELPDALRGVTTSDQWLAHRPELLELFRAQMFGRSPGKPEMLSFKALEEDKNAFFGTATMKRIAIDSAVGDRLHRYVLVVATPNAISGKVPTFLFINNRPEEKLDVASKTDFWPVREMIARGYAIAAYSTNDLAVDDARYYRGGVIRMFEGDSATRPADAWQAISAWAWGASRAMDYLETDARIDAKKVALVGHSRGGKTALWAGAQDERYALIVSNASGCGGASLARRKFGETLKIINDRFPYWFNDNYKQYNDRENEMPFDQHQLIALIAPRPVYIASGSEDLWGDPKGEYLALMHASRVYGLFGNREMKESELPPVDTSLVAGKLGFHIHTGPHSLGVFDWQRFADFADVQWQRTK